jgi:hypothetical protein
MKKVFSFRIALALIVGLFSATISNAQDKPYTEGSVWDVSMIKLKANMGEQYLKSLAATWVKVHEEAKAQGLILSYKVLSGSASNPGDYDILLMTESKNLASLEGNDAKWDAIYAKIVGGEEAAKVLNQNRLDMREIYGDKLMRELKFK